MGRILIIESDTRFCASLSACLASAGYETERVSVSRIGPSEDCEALICDADDLAFSSISRPPAFLSESFPSPVILLSSFLSLGWKTPPRVRRLEKPFALSELFTLLQRKDD